MSHYRKVYEVTGYAPADGGYLVCVGCHADAFPDHSSNECECGAVFLGTETDTAQCCDTCSDEIETSVTGEAA